jgi:hypothetical protein
MTITVHACVLVDPEVYQCRACEFVGTLEDAIEHAVANQFKVEPPTPRPATIKIPRRPSYA